MADEPAPPPDESTDEPADAPNPDHDAMLDTMRRWVPLTHAAFLEYRMHGAAISATGLKVIRRMLAGETVEQASSGLSPREWRELMAVLGR